MGSVNNTELQRRITQAGVVLPVPRNGNVFFTPDQWNRIQFDVYMTDGRILMPDSWSYRLDAMRCTGPCDSYKPLDQFCVDSNTSTGLNPRCRECVSFARRDPETRYRLTDYGHICQELQESRADNKKLLERVEGMQQRMDRMDRDSDRWSWGQKYADSGHSDSRGRGDGI